MASKGGLVAVGGVALSLLALLAFSGEAKAAPKRAPMPEDLHSKEACAAYEQELKARKAARAQMLGQISQLENAMAAAADAGDEAALANYASMQQGWKNQVSALNVQINELQNRIADCP